MVYHKQVFYFYILLFFHVFFELILKREILVQSCHFYSKMCAQLRTHSKKKTKERNTKNILVEQDRWIEVDELMSVTMKEYKEVMQLDEISSMLSFFEYLSFS